MPKTKLIDISIYLPLSYNPEKGKHRRKKIEKEKFKETHKEIALKFGGYSLIKNVEGVWVDPKGKTHKDTHNVLLILTADTPETRSWLRHYKKVLEQRFEQIEMFIKVSETEKV